MDTIVSFALDLLRIFYYDILRGLLFHAGRIAVMICTLGRYPKEPVTIRQDVLIHFVGVLVLVGLVWAIVAYRLH